MSEIYLFHEKFPSIESYWRTIILFGRNSASYKFALAQALLDLAEQGKTNVSAEELAIPYSNYICNHLVQEERQNTASQSKFLDTCRKYNSNKLSFDNLILNTVKLGFNNVLDAFHIISGEKIANLFFEKQGNSNTNGIILTDNIYRLKEIINSNNLNLEIEARWNLVETAWKLNISTATLLIEHDLKDNIFFIKESKYKRKNVTSTRHALNGYQKGKCFYCFDDIDIYDKTCNCEVDHYFAYKLQKYTPINLNGVWNLVLACKSCNREVDGKHDKVPMSKYLQRLNNRNNYLVNSHHPLKETIIRQTGNTDEIRRKFLSDMNQYAIDKLIARWDTKEVSEAKF